MAKKKSNPKTETLPFESALDELKTIVRQLEAGNLTLSESLDKYESGVKHLKGCHSALEAAQKKIQLLVQLDDDGNLITEPFDADATIRPNRKTTRAARYTNSEKAVDFEDGDDGESDLNALF